VQVGLGPGHIVLGGDPAPSSPSPKGTEPNFQPIHICCGQMAGWINMPLGMQVGVCPGDFVLDGDPTHPPQKGGGASLPIFRPFLLWPNGWMPQDATWYGGRPQPRGLCVRWGFSPLTKKGTEPPIFSPCLLQPNGCMDQDTTWYGGRPWPRTHSVRWGPSSPSSKRGFSPFPSIWPMSIVAKRLDGLRWYLACRCALLHATLCLIRTQLPPPIFGPFLLWPNGWMPQDVTWYGGRPQPGLSILKYCRYCNSYCNTFSVLKVILQ